jgi:hypothetical protein
MKSKIGTLSALTILALSAQSASATPHLVFFDKRAQVIDATVADDYKKTLGGGSVGITAQDPENIGGINVLKVTVAFTRADKKQEIYKGLVASADGVNYQGAVKSGENYLSLVGLTVQDASGGQGQGNGGGAGDAAGAGGAGGAAGGSGGNGGGFGKFGPGDFGDKGKGGGSDDNGLFKAGVMPPRDEIVSLCGANFVDMAEKDKPLFDRLAEQHWLSQESLKELNSLLEAIKANGSENDSALAKRVAEALAKLHLNANSSVTAARNLVHPQVSELTKANLVSLFSRSHAIAYTALVQYFDDAAAAGTVAKLSGLSSEASDAIKVLGFTGGDSTDWLVEPKNPARTDEINKVLSDKDVALASKQRLVAAVMAIWFGATMNSDAENERYMTLADAYLKTVAADSTPTVRGVQSFVVNSRKLLAPRYSQTADSQWFAQANFLTDNVKDAKATWISFLKREVTPDERLAALKEEYGDYSADLQRLARVMVSYHTDEKEKISIFVRITKEMTDQNGGQVPSSPIERWVQGYFASEGALCTEDPKDTAVDAKAADFALNLIKLIIS